MTRSRSRSRRKNSKIAIKTNPKLWEKIKKKWIRSNKGGPSGKNSARKMQFAVSEYKRSGGEYKNSSGRKKTSLSKWTREKWDYIGSKRKNYGRYLPKKVRDSLSLKEKRIENSRKGNRRGKRVSYSRSVLKKMRKYKIGK